MDRQPHVGHTELGDDRPVGQLDQRVDDRLRMHDHVDRRRRRPEQPVRLDHLEALVHERRRVDGDLAAPSARSGGCSASVDGDAGQRPRRSGVGRARPRRSGSLRRASEGSRRCRHWWMALCSLSTGSTSTPWARARSITSRPAIHQHFLVGQRDPLAGANRGDDRYDTAMARRRAEHRVDAVAGHQIDQRLRSGGAQVEVSLGPGRQLRPECVAGGVGGHDGGAGPVALDLQRQRGGAGAGEADHLQAIRVRVDDGQRAVTDRAGRAEDREAGSGAAGIGLETGALEEGVVVVEEEHAVGREHEQQRVDAIEDAAVAGDQARRILDAAGALQQRRKRGPSAATGPSSAWSADASSTCRKRPGRRLRRPLPSTAWRRPGSSSAPTRSRTGS